MNNGFSRFAMPLGSAVFGSLFFGSVTKLEQLLDPAHDPARPPDDIVVLELHQVINLDTTGLDALRSVHRMLQRRGGRLLIADPNEQPLSLMQRSGYLDSIGNDAVYDTLGDALASVTAPAGPA